MKQDTIKISTAPTGTVIAPELHSQFIEHLGSCIYDGIWVGKDSDIPNIDGFRKDVVEPLAKLQPPVIRWPGGCFADMYHWKNGIGDSRPVTYNGNFGTYKTEDNSFGTDEFMAFCRLVGGKPWLNINMLSGDVREAVEWSEYCNRKESTALSDLRAANGSKEPYNVQLWGIGNEVWAGGGNMTPEMYAQQYRKFASAMPSFVEKTPDGITALPQTFILSGPDGNKPKERVKWTKDLFASLAQYRQPKLDAIDLHFYNWNVGKNADDADDFTEEGWYRVVKNCLEIRDVIDEQYELVQEGIASFPESEDTNFPSPVHKCDLYIGEWGNWHQSAFFAKDALWQQCSMRDAVTSALTLDIFHHEAEKLKLACCAQTVNVLGSLFLTEGDKTILTPNYYVYEMYMVHRGAELLADEVETAEAAEGLPAVMTLASRKEDVISVNIVCTDYSAKHEVLLTFDENVFCNGGETLHADKPTDCNTAQEPEKVKPAVNTTARLTDKGWVVRVPAASVNVFHFQIANH